jgi:hypothetical protein
MVGEGCRMPDNGCQMQDAGDKRGIQVARYRMQAGDLRATNGPGSVGPGFHIGALQRDGLFASTLRPIPIE